MSICRLLAPVLMLPLAFAQKPEKYAEAAVEGHMVEPARRDFAEGLLSELKGPPGFRVSVFATELKDARIIAVADSGAVYVSRPDLHDVILLRDSGSGRAGEARTVASNIPGAHGLMLHGGKLYIAGTRSVYVADVNGDGTLGAAKEIIQQLPGGGQHSKRTIGLGPDGNLYISVGSDCNVCEEDSNEHAAILQTKLDGTGNRQVFAKGLRNTIGFAWNPATKEMWGMDNGSDWRGDDTPPEELNKLVQGGNYGWPFCYGDRLADAAFSHDPPKMTKEQYCAGTKGPALTIPAHSAPIAMVFYNGTQFPSEYRGSAFVALRGSWNRRPPVGYKVIRIVFENGQPVRTEDFLSGFLGADGRSYFGRPAGLAVARDGSLLLSDDTNGVVYRISYGK